MPCWYKGEGLVSSCGFHGLTCVHSLAQDQSSHVGQFPILVPVHCVDLETLRTQADNNPGCRAEKSGKRLTRCLALILKVISPIAE